jgi:ribosome biogenesis GTPase
MSRRHSRLDEDDVRVRPSRGKSRPRSKLRPEHGQAVPGFVTAVDRGRYTVRLVDANPALAVTRTATLFAVKARELGRKGIVVGDHVSLVGDLTGGPDALARIIRRLPRRTVLRRTADDTDPTERVVVANADQLAVVVALAEPAPRTRLIDRALVAAFEAGLRPLLVLTKSDLAAPDELLRTYASLAVSSVVTRKGADHAALRESLTDHQTVLLGHSGVGKSTLVNALVPEAQRSTGHVNVVTGRGRHTSTSAVALELPEGGWVVDTPGIRSFGLAHVDLARFMHAFPDLDEGTQNCPRGCTHELDERADSVDVERCGLDAWVAAGRADPERLSSLRRLLASRSSADDD